MLRKKSAFDKLTHVKRHVVIFEWRNERSAIIVLSSFPCTGNTVDFKNLHFYASCACDDFYCYLSTYCI